MPPHRRDRWWPAPLCLWSSRWKIHRSDRSRPPTTAGWPPATTGTAIATADGIIYDFTNATTGTACPGEPDVQADGTLDPDFDIYAAATCGTGRVDVNGVKGPNTAVTNSAKPEDQFTFTIFETKVVPGTAATSVEAAVMYDNKTATAGS